MSLLAGGLVYLGAQALQNYYNNKAADKQNDSNWDMWQATNEYNKPVNQMKRFEEAGLNKNLIYGQTNTTSPVSMAGPQPVQVENPLLQYYQMKNAELSNDKLNAEIAGIKAGIENQNVRTMSDQWDLLQRIRGGYGSDSGFFAKNFGGLFNIGYRAGQQIHSGSRKMFNKLNSEDYHRAKRLQLETLPIGVHSRSRIFY